MRKFPLSVALLAVLGVVLSRHPEAAAQITLRPSYRVHEPAEVTLQGTPDVSLWRLPTGVAAISQDDGRRLFVWAAAGRYPLSVTCISVDWDGKKISAIEHAAVLVIEGGTPPDPPPGPGPNPTPGPISTKVTQVTLVYEKSLHPLPRPVLAELDRLNRAGILATVIEQDIVDGMRQVPDQYAAAIAAAKAAGLPCLVVQAGSTVLRTKRDPKTAQDVTEALK